MEANCCVAPYEETSDSEAEGSRNTVGDPDEVKRVHPSRKRARLYEERRKIRLTRTARKLKQVRKKIDACYAYEIYSNLCGPSRLPASTDEEPLYDRATLLFEERVDMDFGLQDKLLANGVISGSQYADIKTSQSSQCRARKLWDYIQGKASDFILALQRTKQQHLLNYTWSSGIYNPKFEGDWPLTDRQMMTLNVNQEVLIELMDMSPELVEQLYSIDVLNKRQKEFICGQLSKLKQSETFLDILRRRSFRDYKETIKCLCTSNQNHIAEIFKRGVVGRILCLLRKPVKNSLYNANRIVDNCSAELSRWSVQGGICNLKLTKNGLIDVRYDNGIVLYFHFRNQEELSKTKDTFCTGKMDIIAEADFNALLAANHIAVALEWPADDFKRCNTYLQSRPFAETNVQDCPMEVLEMILSKAYALYFHVFPPHPPEKKLFALLSSVSSYWHRTIARRRFKSTLTKCLFPYFQMVSKRNTIIRRNRKYLIENIEPTDILIKRMTKFGCLTRKEADFIASLQHNTEKNQELLNIARSLSFKKHFAFVESLHLCGQLNVAKVLEKGGVVVTAKIIHTTVSNSAEFIKLVNTKIDDVNAEHSERLNELLVLDKQETLEILEVKQLGRRKRNENCVIYLWCKSQKSLRKLRQQLESDELFKRVDILISCLNSDNKDSLYNLYYKTQSPQFMKRLTIDPIQLQNEVAVRQMSLECSGTFDLSQFIMALTSLGDKIYVLLEHLVSIHQDIAPFACQSRIAFHRELKTSFSSQVEKHRCFMVACDETKCIYIVNDKDSHLWKLTTPDYELKVWMSDIGDPFSIFVARNGNVVLLKEGDASQAGMNHYRLEIYNKDAVRVHEILIPSLVEFEHRWAMEILPGKLALNIRDNLSIRPVDFTTLIADPDEIMFPKSRRRWLDRHIAGITSYCEGQILVLLSKNLALFDSQLNVDIIPTSAPIDAKQLHFKKDKRQLMFWSHDLNTVQIYTLAYKAEDMFAGDP